MSTDQLRQRIESYRDLQIGWDSRGGTPPSDQTIAYALKIIEISGLLPADTTVSPFGDGQITFEWEDGQHVGSLEVDVS